MIHVWYTPLCLGIGDPDREKVGVAATMQAARRLALDDARDNERIVYRYSWSRGGQLFTGERADRAQQQVRDERRRTRR